MSYEKITSLENLVKIINYLRKEEKKIVHCHGVFDLLHPGHIHHLQSAKKNGDILVVSLTRDAYVNKGPGRPVFNENLRAQTIAALEVVDYVCFSENPDATECIKMIKPDFYVKGADYSNSSKDFTGKIVEEKKAVELVGGKILLTDDAVVFSSTSLINKFLGGLSEEQKKFLDSFKEKYNTEKILEELDSLKNLNVLLVGDTIIDEYVYCEPIGQSLKNPLVVNKFLKRDIFCGGVLAVANHIAGFCKEVNLVTMLGTENSYEEYIKKNLKKNVTVNFFYRRNTPTVVKKRYLYSSEQKVFEVCYIDDEHPIENQLELQIEQYLKNSNPSDLTMVADFGHGLLTEKIISQIKSISSFLAVNAQTNSANLGYNFITKKYNEIGFVSIDEAEARLALHNKYYSLEEACKKLSANLDIKQIIITCGKNGSVSFEKDKFYKTPAFTSRVVDRVGAVDAFYAISALCSAKGMPLELTSFIGNVAGSLAVQIVGNKKPIDKVDIYKFTETLLK